MSEASSPHSAQKSSKAILVSLDLNEGQYSERLKELQLLAASDQIDVMAVIEGKRSHPDPKMYVGSGKADEIAKLLVNTGSDMVIFNHELTPAQQRNLMQFLNVPVIDRTRDRKSVV